MKFLKAFIIINITFCISFASTYKLTRKEIKEENTTKNYTISVVYPQMEGFRDKSIQKDLNKYIFEKVTAEVDNFKREIKGWPAMTEYPSSFEIADTVFIQNENILSIRFDGYQYFSGAAHPSTFFFSVNYNLNDNEEINFPDIFKGDYLIKISDYCIQDLIRQKNEYTDNPDISWIKEGAGPKEENFIVFNLLESSLLITFPAYQVASYAEGPKEVNIPYSKIMTLIDKKGPLAYIIR